MTRIDDILDVEVTVNNTVQVAIRKTFVLFLVSLFLFFVLSYIWENYVPNSWDNEDFHSGVIVILIFLIGIFNSIYFTSCLNRIEPSFQAIFIIFACGFYIFFLVTVFKFLQNIVFFDTGLNQDYFDYLQDTVIAGCLTLPIAAVKISIARKKGILWAIIFLILNWWLISHFFM